MAGIKDTASSKTTALGSWPLVLSKTKREKPKTSRTKAPDSGNDDARVTRFPELRGKVIRLIQFRHEDYDNVLTIHLTDGTFLVFDIYPEPLLLPLDISAAYVRTAEGKTRARRWPGLAEDK